MSDAYSNVPMPDPSIPNATPGTMGGAAPTRLLPDPKNFAKDYDKSPDLTHQVRELYAVTMHTRRDRSGLEDEWNAIQNMEAMTHDNGRRYMGRSAQYIPLFARIVQTKVSTLAKGLFPTDEFFSVSDDGGDYAKAAGVKALLNWELTKNAKVKRQTKPMLRQYSKFGLGIWKVWFEKHVPTRKQGTNTLVDNVVTASFSKPGVKQGLRISPRNISNVYMWPTTAQSLDEAMVVFEDIAVPRQYAMEMVRRKLWASAALNAPTPAEFRFNQMNQADNSSVGAPIASPVSATEVGGQLVVTEVYTFMRLPAEAYVDGEDKDEAVPTLCIFAGGEPIVLMRNPYFHQKSVYLAGRVNSDPGMFYGYGDGRTTRPLQYLTNDFANQTVDVGSYALNPIIKANPGLLAGPLRPVSPGVVWAMTDVQNGAIFDRPPVDLIQYGSMMFNTFSGMGMDLSGAPPVMQGTGAGKGAKTATGAQILQRNAMAPLQDMVEDLEHDVLIPLLWMSWMYAQQYRDSNLKFAISGGQQLDFTPEQLFIDANFEWLASSQAQNAAQRTQQAIQFLQALVPWVPILAQTGQVLNPTPLLRKVYTEGFGFRGFDDIIKQAAQGAGGAPASPEQQAAAAQDSIDKITNALASLGGDAPTADPTAGETEDFTDVRNQSDELSSMGGSFAGGTGL